MCSTYETSISPTGMGQEHDLLTQYLTAAWLLSHHLISKCTTTCHTTYLIIESSLHLLLLVTSRLLALRCSPKLLATVLPLFPLLSAGLLDLGRRANPHLSVVGLKLFHRLDRVVDEREARSFAAAVLCAHAEDVDLVLG